MKVTKALCYEPATTVRLWSTDTGDCILVHDLGTASYNLSFNPNGQTLHTDTGAISLNNLLSPTKLITANDNNHPLIFSNQVIPDPDQNHLSGYGINTTKDWITLNGNNLFWLPADYRPMHLAVSGSMVVTGCASGCDEPPYLLLVNSTGKYVLSNSGLVEGIHICSSERFTGTLSSRSDF